MTRKKVALEYIVNENSRRASLKKRREGLKKKVKDLTTLCDILACVIIYSENEEEAYHFPESRDEIEKVLKRFESVPEMDRERKKHDHATYSASRVFKIRDQIAKKKRESQELEMSIYLHDIYWFLKGYNQFSPTELSSLCQYLQDAWSECVRRIQYIGQVNHATRGGEGHLLPQEEAVMQQVAGAPWEHFPMDIGLPQNHPSNNIPHLSQDQAYVPEGVIGCHMTTSDYELPLISGCINNNFMEDKLTINYELPRLPEYTNRTSYQANYIFAETNVKDHYGDESFVPNFTFSSTPLSSYGCYNGATQSQVFGNENMPYNVASSSYIQNIGDLNGGEDMMQPYLSSQSTNMAQTGTTTSFNNACGGSGDGMMQLYQEWDDLIIPQLGTQGGDDGCGYASLLNQEWNNDAIHFVHQANMI